LCGNLIVTKHEILLLQFLFFLGGYAFVFIAQDVQGGQDFALKVC